jgi:acyl-CoA thioesterase
MPHPNILDSLCVERVPGAQGKYRARVSGDWNAPVHPNGGLTSALALRAMEAELATPHQTLRTFSTTFVSTVASGDVEISVEKLRIGNRMSQLRADVNRRGRDEPGHVVTAAFGESRDGFDFSYLAPPAVEDPDAYPGPPVPPAGASILRAPFFDNIDSRRVRMFSSFERGWKGGRAEAIRWLRYRTAPRRADGIIEPLALIPIADTMPSAVGQHLGPGFPLFHAPSVDLSVRILASTQDEWLLVRSVAHWAGSGYASAETAIWDWHRRLLAHANQMMLIRFPDPKELVPKTD